MNLSAARLAAGFISPSIESSRIWDFFRSKEKTEEENADE